MKSKLRWIICPLAMLLTSCTASGGVNDFCVVGHPITVSDEDVLTDTTARMILRHDMTGDRLCGWKP